MDINDDNGTRRPNQMDTHLLQLSLDYLIVIFIIIYFITIIHPLILSACLGLLVSLLVVRSDILFVFVGVVITSFDDAKVDDLIAEVDKDKSGTIEFNEFLDIIVNIKVINLRTFSTQCNAMPHCYRRLLWLLCWQ
jgi:hypothetical protein